MKHHQQTYEIRWIHRNKIDTYNIERHRIIAFIKNNHMPNTECGNKSSACCSGESSDRLSKHSCSNLKETCCPRTDDPKIEMRSIQYNMIHEHVDGPDVWKYYDNLALIGEGSISNIYKVRKHMKKNIMDLILCRGICVNKDVITNSRKGNQYYGLKQIDTKLVNKVFLEEMKNEIEMFRSMDHPNILRAYEVFHLKNHISIIMELCTGGDLYTRNPYTEKEAAVIMKQLVSAVSYMHKKKIIHRDRKFNCVILHVHRLITIFIPSSHQLFSEV